MPLLPDAHGVFLADVRPDRWWRRALHRLVSRLSRRLDDAWDDVGWTDDPDVPPGLGVTILRDDMSWSEPGTRTHEALLAYHRGVAREFAAVAATPTSVLVGTSGPVDAETYRLLTGRDVRADVAANQLSAAVDDAHQLYAFLVRDVGNVAAFQHAKALADLRRRWGL